MVALPVPLLVVVIVALVVLVAALVGQLLALRRIAATDAKLLEDQLNKACADVASMGQALAESRIEAKEQAARDRLQTQESYAAHLGTLQSRMHEVLRLTQNSVDNSRQAVDVRLQHLAGSLTTQLGSQTQVILQVQEQLGALGEAAKGMAALGQDIASLQDILQAPKLRGNLGELLLAEILRQVLPPDSFMLQHRFDSDADRGVTIVDAVICLGDRLVPIDSKFPLESFRRILAEQQLNNDAERRRQRKQFLEAVRGHIDSVAQKYIRPDANTYDFALMYLPAENVYYESVVRHVADDGLDSIVSYAAQKRVIPVSPSTLYAYLLTVAYGLRGLHIERQAEIIRGQLQAFNKKFLAFYKDLQKTGKNLQLAHRNFDDVLQRGAKLNDQVGKITGAALHIGEPDVKDAAAPHVGAEATC